MKRSPSSCCSSSSSSSSSYAGPETPHLNQAENQKPKAKRIRKNQNNPTEKCQNGTNPNTGGGRRSSIYRGVTRSMNFPQFFYREFPICFSMGFLNFHLHVWNFAAFCVFGSTGIDGLEDLKLISGIRAHGTTFRTKKDDKVIKFLLLNPDRVQGDL